MIKRMVIELDRDPALYPDGNIVEVSGFLVTFNLSTNVFHQWPRATGHHNPVFDGFTVRRTGDMATKIRVIMYLDHFPDQFKVSPELGGFDEFFADILSIQEEFR